MPIERMPVRKCKKQDEITNEPVTNVPIYDAYNNVINIGGKYDANDFRSLLKGSDAGYRDVSGMAVRFAVRLPNGEFSRKSDGEIIAPMPNDYVVVYCTDDDTYYSVDLKVTKFWSSVVGD